jgi:hypothetical protein
MSCAKCPHCVRLGTPIGKSNKIEFKDICSLKIKELQNKNAPNKPVPKNRIKKKAKSREINFEQKKDLYSKSICHKAPFTDNFEYNKCEVLLEKMKVPSKDITLMRSPHLIDQLGKSVLELDLL